MALCLLFSVAAFSDSDYTIEDAYYECKAENPEFVESITSQGVTDEQFIYFIQTIFDYMQSLGDTVTRENYRDYIPDAIEFAFKKRKNIRIRDTLTSTYPDAVVDATHGIVADEFRPLYETLRRIIFEHNLLNLAPRVDSASTVRDGAAVKVEATYRNILNEILYAAAYDSEGTLLAVSKVTNGEASLAAVNAAYVKVMCFKGLSSLAPVCEAVAAEIE